MTGPGRVTRVSGPTATVAWRGVDREARVSPRLPGRPLAVGDLVDLAERGEEVVIVAIRPRASVIERVSRPDGPRRPVVANADVMLVVESLTRPEPRPHLIDRYLVAAWAGRLEAAVVLTKADLLAAEEPAATLRALYTGLGYPTLVGSAKDPAFVADVASEIGGRTAALVGQSGVGKSTLTRGLTGLDRTVGTVSERSGTGRHTTSDPRLFPLDGGGAVVDTAGIRTLFLPQLEPAELGEAFPEIRAVAGRCRFRDCRHLGEEGCALPGRIAPTRRESYERLMTGS